MPGNETDFQQVKDSVLGILSTIHSPDDLRKLPVNRLNEVAEECRETIIQTVSRTGGHLASNLGVVELTIALHYAFNAPYDKLIWDVGHQVYTHKILTGRYHAMQKGLRQFKGISGFPKRAESPYDHYDTGHSGTSISFALGLAESILKSGGDAKVIPIIGDGSMTAGIAFEGLNQGGQIKPENLIVILNDNEMSISENVGGLAEYISHRMVSRKGIQVRKIVKSILQTIPRKGQNMVRLVQKLERSIKDLIQPGLFFDELGFQYLGPFDGHRLDTLVELFKNVRSLPGPLLVHVLTRKGFGYKHAENQPERFHGASSFDISSGRFIKKTGGPPSYTSVFGKAVVDLAEKDENIVAITAAMTLGTGLTEFSERFRNRFYDVGIAEQHAVTFAAGLAAGGKKPVVAIYSTFLQRAYDQVFHDVCLQNLPVIFMLDRGGLVGADGPTHHGVFDLSFLRNLPGLIIMAPRDENELRQALFSAMEYQCPVAIRYPRGAGIGVPVIESPPFIPVGIGELLKEGGDLSIIAAGPLAYAALDAAELAGKQGIDVEVIDARFVKPLDEPLILKSLQKTKHLITIEENALAGGFSGAVMELLADASVQLKNVHRMGIPDRFIEMGTQEQLRKTVGLNTEAILDEIKRTLNKPAGKRVAQPAEVGSSFHGFNPGGPTPCKAKKS